MRADVKHLIQPIYPGFESILGPDLSMKMLAGTEKFGVELKHDTVEKIENGGSIKIINGLNPAFPNCVTIITRKTAITIDI